MNAIQLVGIGRTESALLADLCADLGSLFRLPCTILPQSLDPEFAYNLERRQFHSTALLARLAQSAPGDGAALLGVAEADLYIPILMFVFGEAQMARPCAVISSYRLRQEFYGLPADPALLRQRLCKEAAHELGHTMGLRHCQDYQCAMAPSHSVDWMDLKLEQYCDACLAQVAGRMQHAARPG